MEKLYDLELSEGPPVLQLVRDASQGGYQLRDELACVGHLRIGQWPGMQAVFAGETAWSFDSVRQGRSTVGVAWEARSGEAIVGFYPSFWRPGGQIACQETSYRLSAPLVRLGWRLRDEDDALLAVISARPQNAKSRRPQDDLPDQLTVCCTSPPATSAPASSGCCSSACGWSLSHRPEP